MIHSRAFVVILLLWFLAGLSIAQQNPSLQSVWELISAKYDGKEVVKPNIKQYKLITKNHYVWIHQDKTSAIAALANKTQKDSLSAYYDHFSAGAGTYTFTGNTYTETVEIFQEPQYIGRSLPFTVKIEGDRLYQSGKFPIFEGDKLVREMSLEEVYKRIE